MLEALCEGLYSSHDSAERANAENMFKQFFQDPNFISQLEYVLENAKNPYAVYFASSSLLKHVTDNNPPSQLQLQIRNIFSHLIILYLDCI